MQPARMRLLRSGRSRTPVRDILVGGMSTHVPARSVPETKSYPGAVDDDPFVTRGMRKPEPSFQQGRIILLNGASSSGKSTLARGLQDALDSPFLHVSSDRLLAAGLLPQRRETEGPFAWRDEMRPRFFAGFHRCLPAFAAAGNDLIVEHIIECASWRQQLALLLAGFDVYLVGVHCELGELDRRERLRGDRRIGEGRAHVERDRIHDVGPYDHEVDTTDGATAELVEGCVDAWRQRGAVRALNFPQRENIHDARAMRPVLSRCPAPPPVSSLWDDDR